jgi:predicted PurR-regulated permease PerM
MAAGWFLGCIVVAFFVLAWLRGAGRFLIPLLLIGAIAYGLRRFVQKLREPLP